MNDRKIHGGAKRWLKGVVAVGLLAVLLDGCAIGGKSEADAAVAGFEQIDHVVDARITVSRPGLPTNTNYNCDVVLDEDLSDAEVVRVVLDALVVARDELGSTSTGGLSITFSAGGYGIDLKDVASKLGSVGNQFSLSEGSLAFSRSELKSYVSPSDEA